MAHEITYTDKFGEVRAGGKRAWHGLGVELPPGLTAVEAFAELGLNWETELGTLSVAYTDATGQPCVATDPDHRGHVRRDTGTVLGIVGADYHDVPNKGLAEFTDMVLGLDRAVTVETGGSLRGGRRVFVLANLPGDIQVAVDDTVKNYLCVANGHDGVSAFIFGYTPIRVVCANTLRMAESNMKGGRFCHTGDVAAKLEMARMALGLSVTAQGAFADKAKAMAKKVMDETEIKQYMLDVYKATFGEETTEKHEMDVVGSWYANLFEASNTVKSTDHTLWHAMNCVTYWHDHQRGRFASSEKEESRAHSNLFGISATHKKIAMRKATALLV